jgi:triphosphoribosyl-dephospho-CoA synthetase
VQEIDVWRSASLLLKRHGPDAALFAAMRADQLLDQGEVEGCRVWQRIVRAIRDLERTPNSDAQRN